MNEKFILFFVIILFCGTTSCWLNQENIAQRSNLADALNKIKEVKNEYALLTGGLSEYDASTESFTNYFNQKGNIKSLSNNIVMSIVEDKSGVLWVATLGGGLEQFNLADKTFTHYRHNPPCFLGNQT